MAEHAAHVQRRDEVLVRSPDSGEQFFIPAADAEQRIAEGWQPGDQEQLRRDALAAEYAGRAGEAFAAGAARGASLGLSDVVLTRSGLAAPSTLARLREFQPEWSTGGELVGAAGSMLIPGAPIGLVGRLGARAGTAAAGALAARTLAPAAGLMPRMAGALARGVTEGAVIGAGAGATEAALADLDTFDSLRQVAHHALVGASVGAGFGVLSAGTLAARRAVHRKLTAGLDEVIVWRQHRSALRAQLDVASTRGDPQMVERIQQALSAASAQVSEAQARAGWNLGRRAVAYGLGAAAGGALGGPLGAVVGYGGSRMLVGRLREWIEASAVAGKGVGLAAQRARATADRWIDDIAAGLASDVPLAPAVGQAAGKAVRKAATAAGIAEEAVDRAAAVASDLAAAGADKAAAAVKAAAAKLGENERIRYAWEAAQGAVTGHAGALGAAVMGAHGLHPEALAAKALIAAVAGPTLAKWGGRVAAVAGAATAASRATAVRAVSLDDARLAAAALQGAEPADLEDLALVTASRLPPDLPGLVRDQAAQAQATALGYLQQQAPAADADRVAQARWREVLEAVVAPELAIQGLVTGHGSRAGMDAVAAVYPEAHRALVAEVTATLATLRARGREPSRAVRDQIGAVLPAAAPSVPIWRPQIIEQARAAQHQPRGPGRPRKAQLGQLGASRRTRVDGLEI